MLGHERVLCILVTLAALDTAERPRLKQHVIEADESEDESTSVEGGCPQDAAVRRALRSLGFTEWKLRSLLKSKTWMETGARGVHWSEEDRCAVTEINFPHEGHQEDRQTRDTLDTRQRAVTQKEGMTLKAKKHLYLQNTEVTGNLSSLGNMTRMKRLDLSHTTISGDLEHLRPLRQLRTLRLSDTLVTGDLQSLQASQLQVLALEDGGGGGDLYLPNTKVSGDLMALQNALFLQELTTRESATIRPSRISGDLAALKQAMDLEVLSAENTDISGDLQVLNMKHLNLLHLPNTSVVGHLGSLRTAIWLRDLAARQRVERNDLEQVDLSRSAVRGKLTAAWRGCCQRLRSLKLSDSSVRLLPPPGPDRDALREIWSEGGHRFLPDLSILEVSGCPLNASVEEFLAPFLGCSALASLKAAHCGLRGAVPDLHHIKWVKRNGRFWSAWESDLARSLQTLDLSFNDISYVANIPRDAQAVILASNPPMVLAPGVLLRAVEEHIFLGLQNVRLHSVEAEQLLEDKDPWPDSPVHAEHWEATGSMWGPFSFEINP
eukprot:g6536.t1